MADPDIRKIGAVILAAGRSTRQKGFKPLLPIGPQTVIEHCIRLFAGNGVSHIKVVLGHRADELRPVVAAAGGYPVINPDYDQGMFSSVMAGVAALPADIAGFFVLPVDIPLVRPITLEILQALFHKDPDHDVFLPEFAGRTGHPPILREHLRGDIAGHNGEKGLRGVLEKRAATRVPVPDRHILEDIDTPEQYRKALDLWQRRGTPAPEEAKILLERECRESPEVIAHSRAVARIAGRLADAVNETGVLNVDRGLVVSAALLHDIAKGQPAHCHAGAKRLQALGFSNGLTDIVARHADYDPVPNTPINEIELVYLANKLVQGSEGVRFDARFQSKYDRFTGNEDARQAVMKRWRQASGICERVEKVIGREVKSLL